jgi:uncharacterized repeat protein (TIGR03806 family)
MASAVTRRCWRGLFVLSFTALLSTGCARKVRTHLDGPFPEKLSSWNLFVGAPSALTPNLRVIPYDLNTPLFTDYATKRRFVWMPEGTAAVYNAEDTFELPKGAILSKTFSYPDAKLQGSERLIETRLLVNTNAGWVALPYVWNAKQTEAILDLNADPVAVTTPNPSGGMLNIHYLVPNANQCKGCHDQNKITEPIGPKARHLNRDFQYPEGRMNEIAYWTKIGYLKGAPEPKQAPRQAVWNDPSTGSLEERARAYLEVNCAHCHNTQGAANTTGLYLSDLQKDAMRIGFCKTPVATGNGSGDLLFDAVPGHPEESILTHRLSSDEPKVMMPEVGRTLIHREGLKLITEWISSMQGGCELRRAKI